MLLRRIRQRPVLLRNGNSCIRYVRGVKTDEPFHRVLVEMSKASILRLGQKISAPGSDAELGRWDSHVKEMKQQVCLCLWRY